VLTGVNIKPWRRKREASLKIKEENYNIVILGCCFAIFVTMIGMVNSPSSLFIVPVCDTYGFSRSSFSFTLSFSTICGIFINLFYGKIYRRLGVRKIIALGFISGTMAFLIMWRATTLPLFYLGGLLSGFGMGLNSITTVALLLNTWFKKRKGLLLGFVCAGSGLGGFLFSTLFTHVIVSHGYQTAYLITAVCLFLVGIPVVAFIKEKTVNRENLKKDATRLDEEYFSGFKILLKQRNVRRTFIAAFLLGTAVHAVLVATPGHLENNGIDAITTGTLYGAIFLVLAVAKVVLGWLNDYFGTKKAACTVLCAFIIGTTLLIFVNSVGMAWVYVIIFGMAVPSETVLVPLIARNVLGKKHYKEYLGMYVASLMAGLTAGVPVINFSYDTFGTYVPALILFVALGIVAAYLILTSVSQKKQEPQEKPEDICTLQVPVAK